jgi:hypothetical protein
VFKVHMLGGVVSQGLVAYITMVCCKYTTGKYAILIHIHRALMPAPRMIILGEANSESAS